MVRTKDAESIQEPGTVAQSAADEIPVRFIHHCDWTLYQVKREEALSLPGNPKSLLGTGVLAVQDDVPYGVQVPIHHTYLGPGALARPSRALVLFKGDAEQATCAEGLESYISIQE